MAASGFAAVAAAEEVVRGEDGVRAFAIEIDAFDRRADGVGGIGHLYLFSQTFGGRVRRCVFR